MRISRLHWVPCPLNKCSALGKRTLALRPFQTRADAFVLVILRHCHHVRVTKDLVVATYGDEMMNKANHPIAGERTERPTACFSRHDQMAAWRDLQIRKAKSFLL